MTTEQTFIPKLTMMAVSVDMPSMRAMNRGPSNLQIKSMRRIWAFIAALDRKLASVCQINVEGLSTNSSVPHDYLRQ